MVQCLSIAWLPKAESSIVFSVKSYANVKMALATGFFKCSVVIGKTRFLRDSICYPGP